MMFVFLLSLAFAAPADAGVELLDSARNAAGTRFESLLTQGAAVEARDAEGRGVPHYVVMGVADVHTRAASVASTHFLAELATGEIALELAARRQEEEEILRTYVRAGGDIDLQDHQGETALMWAVDAGAISYAGLLVNLGASPGLADHDAHSALDRAVHAYEHTCRAGASTVDARAVLGVLGVEVLSERQKSSGRKRSSEGRCSVRVPT